MEMKGLLESVVIAEGSREEAGEGGERRGEKHWRGGASAFSVSELIYQSLADIYFHITVCQTALL